MKTPLALLLALAALPLLAQAQNAGRQTPEALRNSVEQFLQVQSNGLPGKVTVTVDGKQGKVKARGAVSGKSKKGRAPASHGRSS